MSYSGGKFVPKSYKENDLLGKQLLVAYLVKKGHKILPETFIEDYKIDIFTEYNGEKMSFEVEMKDKYDFINRSTFPFETVSFLGRKSKWKDTDYTYCIIARITHAAIFCDSKIIFQDEYKSIIPIDTYNRSGYDVFYRVPKELCIFRTPKQFFQENYENIWENQKNSLYL